jgi:hypothetical protein
LNKPRIIIRGFCIAAAWVFGLEHPSITIGIAGCNTDETSHAEEAGGVQPESQRGGRVSCHVDMAQGIYIKNLIGVITCI